MTPSDLPSAAVLAPALVMLILCAGIRAHQNSKERGGWTVGYTIFVWWLRLLVVVWVIGLGVLIAKSG
jgi:hypothetical protein